ncbi:hypothetical protein ILUMI_23951 [Ignelater luminosus]|uniref:Mutator-like transposase domain-containing protein n=1 Tax=Ignelater luminosus TaxID=2038154 RepID=A0A8K0CCY1_IGNLU|nr:hypothetical protein ILUMI_23951 [Ignelater luminosus]
MGKDRAYKNRKRNRKSKARMREWQCRKRISVANQCEEIAQLNNNVRHDHDYFSNDVQEITTSMLQEDPTMVHTETRTSTTTSLHQSSHELHAYSYITKEEIITSNDTEESITQHVVLQEEPITFCSVMEHDIEIEVEQSQENKVKGHRIEDLQYVLNWAMQLQLNHGKKCTADTLEPIQEQRRGMFRDISFKCNFCGFEIKKSTHPQNDGGKKEINVAAVWGTISTGSTYNNLKERLAIMDIPPMPYIKNYGKALYKIRNDTSVAVSGRKLLTAKNIKALQDIAMKVLYINAHGLVEDLKVDLLNGPNHVYNDYSKCKQTYCESVGDKENSKILELKNAGIYHHVHGALDRLVAKGHQLIDNETNNRAELYMSILCKFNAGKRLNLSQRGSFETRANILALRYNNGIGWQSETWKQITSTSPGKHFKKYVANLQHQEANRKERNKTTRTGVKRKLSFTDPCVSQPAQSSAPDYGPNAVEPTMSETGYNSEQQRILQNLQVTKEDIVKIEVHTKGQWDNPLYIMERKGRLTASRFGEVCKR